MLNKNGLHLKECGTTQLVNNFFYHMKKWRTKSLWTTILEEQKCRFKKSKNICLNSSVANSDRPIIYKTNQLEESLNDANRVFENSKECVIHFNQFRNTSCKTLRI